MPCAEVIAPFGARRSIRAHHSVDQVTTAGRWCTTDRTSLSPAFAENESAFTSSPNRTVSQASINTHQPSQDHTMKRFIAITLTLAVARHRRLHVGAVRPRPVAAPAPTADSKFVVTLQPPATPAAINQLHSWQVKLASPAGAPIAHARITVDGGMPQHGHGLPTRPQVTQELADGTYLIEGMKFSMTGWWEIKLAIQTPRGQPTR